MIERQFHLYVDSADLNELRTILPHPLIYGVTTNPTLMRNAGLSRRALPGLVDQVFAWGASAVQVQVESRDADDMVRDARAALSLGPAGRIIPKIPATRAGFTAGGRLADEGLRVTYTAVFAPEQALFAANAGAAYAAPYLGRLVDQGEDALAVIARMQALVSRYGRDTRLLVASVRTREAFLSLLELGVGAITVPVQLMGQLLDHGATLDAERAFLDDAGAPR